MLIAKRMLTGINWRTAILLLLMAALLVPVIIPSGFFFPYVVPRNIFFRAICETGILILAWALCFGGDELDLRYEPIFWALVAFVAAALLSALFSPASNHSLFGDFERMGGVWSWVHLALFLLTIFPYRFRKVPEKMFCKKIIVQKALVFSCSRIVFYELCDNANFSR